MPKCIIISMLFRSVVGSKYTWCVAVGVIFVTVRSYTGPPHPRLAPGRPEIMCGKLVELWAEINSVGLNFMT